MAWSIEAARSATAIDRVIVSTDDDEIAAVAVSYGAEVSMRPAELATDDALVIEAVRDLLRRLADVGVEPRTFVLLEPTCPFRSRTDIEDCLALLVDDSVDSVATFVPAETNPVRAWTIENARPRPFIPAANPWLPRQRLPSAFQLNGAVYAFRADRFGREHESILFGNSAAVVMPHERSVDIDHPLDLLVAEAMLKEELVK